MKAYPITLEEIFCGILTEEGKIISQNKFLSKIDKIYRMKSVLNKDIIADTLEEIKNPAIEDIKNYLRISGYEVDDKLFTIDTESLVELPELD